METRTRTVIINKGHFTRILSRQALNAFKVFWGASRQGNGDLQGMRGRIRPTTSWARRITSRWSSRPMAGKPCVSRPTVTLGSARPSRRRHCM